MQLLITKQGKVIDHSGVMHVIAARINGFGTLQSFLIGGGVRIVLHGENLAIESITGLMPVQHRIIDQLIRDNQIFYIGADIAGRHTERNSFRRIKRL